MTSPDGNIFRVTGLLWGESTGHRWIPLTKASDTELWYFLWSSPERTVEQTMGTLVIWDAAALIMTTLQWYNWYIVQEPYSGAPEKKNIAVVNRTHVSGKWFIWICFEFCIMVIGETRHLKVICRDGNNQFILR